MRTMSRALAVLGSVVALLCVVAGQAPAPAPGVAAAPAAPGPAAPPAPAPAPAAPGPAGNASSPGAPAPAPGPAAPPLPTLSPDRVANYVPVKTVMEHRMSKFGPTPKPPQTSYTCTHQPGVHGCDCKQIIRACGEESQRCEKSLEDVQETIPKVGRDNLLAKIDHPLLNTFVQLNSQHKRKLLSRSREHEQGQCCLKSTVGSLLETKKAHSEQPMGEVLKEFGWRMFDEGPDLSSSMAGSCTPAEMRSLQQCLVYFFSCHDNEKRLWTWVDAREEETHFIDTHPGRFPGLY